MPEGTIGCITGEVSKQGKRYWVVSFLLPQAHVFGIMLYSDEHPDREVFYQVHELRKVRGKEPRPPPLMTDTFPTQTADNDLALVEPFLFNLNHDHARPVFVMEEAFLIQTSYDSRGLVIGITGDRRKQVKQLGNVVTPPVMQCLVKYVLDALA